MVNIFRVTAIEPEKPLKRVPADLVAAPPASTTVVMSDVWRETIVHDASKESFIREYGAALDQRYGEAAGAEYHWRYLELEQSNNIVWSLNNLAERILDRKPNTLRAWLHEHRPVFLG